MNTRSLEPRNFWGLVKQIGPWKTTSVDQSHLAQGYDSPHNNRQFVSPYQQDGTATIPDQKYTRRTIVDIGEETKLQFKDGRIKKTPRVFDIAGFQEPFFVRNPNLNPDRVRPQAVDEDGDIQMKAKRPTDLKIDTTNLMNISQPVTGGDDRDDNDTSMVSPTMDSNFLTTSNPVIQDIKQVAVSDKQDFRTAVATNSWTQPSRQLTTNHSFTDISIVERFQDAQPDMDVDLVDETTQEFPTRGQKKKIRVKKESSMASIINQRVKTNRLQKKSGARTPLEKIAEKGRILV